MLSGPIAIMIPVAHFVTCFSIAQPKIARIKFYNHQLFNNIESASSPTLNERQSHAAVQRSLRASCRFARLARTQLKQRVQQLPGKQVTPNSDIADEVLTDRNHIYFNALICLGCSVASCDAIVVNADCACFKLTSGFRRATTFKYVALR